MSLKNFFVDLFTHRRQLRELRQENGNLRFDLFHMQDALHLSRDQLYDEYKRSTIVPMTMFKAEAESFENLQEALKVTRIVLKPERYAYEYLMPEWEKWSDGRRQYVAKEFARYVQEQVEGQMIEALKNAAEPLDK